MIIFEENSMQRRYLPEDLKIDSWEVLRPYFEDLRDRELKDVAQLENWLLDRSELDAVLEEDVAWRYIHMNIDTKDEEKQKRFQLFIQDIQPKISPFENIFNKKLYDCPFTDQLDQDLYKIYLRGVKKAIELFREENIPLNTEQSTMEQEYGTVAAGMEVEMEGKTMTLQQASVYLKKNDRALRKEAFDKMNAQRMEQVDTLDNLMDRLVKIRGKIAKNADFDNYRDYKFESLGRFDYTVSDCYDFHESIREEISPIVAQFSKERKATMGLDVLRPWDTAVDAEGREPLKPFENGEELLEKAKACFANIDPFFGECLKTMDEMGHLDLVSKQGKAPGGFLYPLYESGVPFIFMNAVGLLRDWVTMIHEGGHAVHSFLSHDLKLTSFKSTPSEVAELASMSMELISLDQWGMIFSDNQELKRAKKEHLKDILSVLPWIAIVDKFQHWIYTNPEHTADQRAQAFYDIQSELVDSSVDWTGLDKSLKYQWQKQLHIYEVPFYYIEYGMAQLGAIAIWRNYKENPKKALEQYKDALELGYTKSIKEIYEAAGIRFDFSREYVKELAAFVKAEIAALEEE